MTNQFFVLRSKASGKWIALDQASGGYPYEVSEPKDAHLFPTRHDAARYTLTMLGNKADTPVKWTLEEIVFHTEPVDKQFTEAEFRIIQGWKGY